MPDELIDIFDENYELQGKKLRSEAQEHGFWVHSFHCWIVRGTDPGFVLFQKRGANKKIYPNCLDISAAGHYRAGEELADGVREIEEELGVKVDYADLVGLGVKIDVGKVGEATVREFCNVYFLRRDALPKSYCADGVEVEGLVQISIPDGLALFRGDRKRVLAAGVEYQPSDGQWRGLEIEVSKMDFVPRVDPYYYKVFIMAARFLEGKADLAI